MQSLKQETIELIKRLPDNCSLEDIMYELYFKQKVKRGLKELKEGKFIPHEEAKKRMGKWLKSPGR